MDVKSLGIPTEEEFVSLYSELTGTADLSHKWNFYMAFTFFRVAAILQGVYKRSLQSEGEKEIERGEREKGERESEIIGVWLYFLNSSLSLDQSSADNAKSVGLMAEWFAEKGWEFAQKQEKLSTPSSFRLSGENTHRIHKHSKSSLGKRHCGTTAANITKPAAPKRDYSTPASRLPDSQSVALMTGDVRNFPTNLKQLYEKLVGFMEQHVYPIEEALFEHQRSDGRWIPHFEMERIKVRLSL